MAIKYQYAPDLQKKAENICAILFSHILLDKVKCFRSTGSVSQTTIARCHTIGKLMQKTIGCEPHYALEFLSEKFDKMPTEEQTKVIIHELMHIPKCFGGGFKHHDYVCDRNINALYKKYMQDKNINPDKPDNLDLPKWFR